MKILVDMNVSPLVAEGLQALGHEATHWSHVGKLTASDTEIMAWARRERLVVLTCDLDFGHLLSTSCALLPSVVQVRSQRMTAPLLSALVASAPEAHREELSWGCPADARQPPAAAPAPSSADRQASHPGFAGAVFDWH